MPRMPYRKPFLKWPGGKFRLLERILPELAGGGRYVEVFAGAAAVYLNYAAAEAVVNDVNADLIALYVCLQTEGEGFIRFAAELFCGENNTREAFHALRERFNAAVEPRERAALFLYLNKHAYNGLTRYNGGGRYNVPFGRYARPRFPQEELRAFLRRTREGRTRFVCRDFRDLLAEAGAGDVIYCDPPYVPLSATANFTSYAGTRFGEREQTDLARLARAAHARGATVVLSNHDTPEVRDLYADARLLSFAVRRSISCHGGTRRPVPELLAVYR